MNIKELLKERDITIKQMAQSLNIPYSTLNDIVNNRVDINKIGFGYVMSICTFLDISPYDFYEEKEPEPKENGYRIIIKDKKFFVRMNIYGKVLETYLCKINLPNSKYVKDMARFEYEDTMEKMRFESWINDSI